MQTARRKVLSGFPWTGRFTTKEEIDHYFGENEIQCLLCGKTYRKLGTHLIRTHGVNQDQYRARFALPWSRGLVSRRLSNHFGKIMKERIKNGFDPTPDEAATRKSKEVYRRKDQPFQTNLKSERLLRVNKLRVVWHHEDYEKVLSRMTEQQRILGEVCRDKDLPGYTAIHKYRKRNPWFYQRLVDTFNALPYSVQARAQKLSPQFREDVKRLVKAGWSEREIASKLGVTSQDVNHRLNRKIAKLKMVMEKENMG